jgi:hypothetical protein
MIYKFCRDNIVFSPSLYIEQAFRASFFLFASYIDTFEAEAHSFDMHRPNAYAWMKPCSFFLICELLLTKGIFVGLSHCTWNTPFESDNKVPFVSFHFEEL